jgi:hypothetical protein
VTKRTYPDEELALAATALLRFVAANDKQLATKWSYSPEFTKLAVLLFGFIEDRHIPAVSTPLVDALNDPSIDTYITARLDMLQQEEQRISQLRADVERDKKYVEEREQAMDEFLRNYRSKVRTQMVEMEKAVGTLKRSGMR